MQINESCVPLEANYKRLKVSQLDNNGMFYLLTAMILLMIDDYQTAVCFLSTHKVSKSKKYLMALKTKHEVEQFVHSALYHSIFEMKPDKFLDLLLSYEPH